MTIRCKDCGIPVAEVSVPPGTIVRGYALCNECQSRILAGTCEGCTEKHILLEEAQRVLLAARAHIEDLSFRSDVQRDLDALDRFLSRVQVDQRRGAA